jgi:hypothetical protein
MDRGSGCTVLVSIRSQTVPFTDSSPAEVFEDLAEAIEEDYRGSGGEWTFFADLPIDNALANAIVRVCHQGERRRPLTELRVRRRGGDGNLSRILEPRSSLTELSLVGGLTDMFPGHSQELCLIPVTVSCRPEDRLQDLLSFAVRNRITELALSEDVPLGGGGAAEDTLIDLRKLRVHRVTRIESLVQLIRTSSSALRDLHVTLSRWRSDAIVSVFAQIARCAGLQRLRVHMQFMTLSADALLPLPALTDLRKLSITATGMENGAFDTACLVAASLPKLRDIDICGEEPPLLERDAWLRTVAVLSASYPTSVDFLRELIYFL